MDLSILDNQHPDLSKITTLLRKAGGRPYLVGGCVRDLCLNTSPHDLDIEVFGLCEERLIASLSKSYHLEMVGKQFGVFIIKGLPYDIALPRTEAKWGPRHTDFKINSDPYLPLEKAAARRDFTINAIYLDPETGKICDPFHGQKDLQNRLLRHTSSQFEEDPLRVYRAMQFIARFDLECHPETVELCSKMAADSLPKERVWEEFKKLILKGYQISKGLNFLREVKWLKNFPELAALDGCLQDPHWHPEGDVWTHTLLCMDAFSRRRSHQDAEDLIVGLAVLCHDMGKPETSFIEEGRIRSPRHDKVGMKTAETFLRRLTNDQSILQAIPPLVGEHMTPFQLYKTQSGDAALRRLSLRVGRVDRLLRVCRADREGRQTPWEPLPSPEVDWIESRMEAMGLKSKSPTPILQGRDLIEAGLTPGPKFSEILNQLFHDQIEGLFDDHQSGLIYLKKWLKKHRI